MQSRSVRRLEFATGVRYIVEGSVRHLNDALRLNVSLTSTLTGAQLWADRLELQLRDLNSGQDEIRRRIAAALSIKLVDIECTRSTQERPDNPDLLDLVLRARCLEDQPHSSRRNQQIQVLYERALQLEPSSVAAKTGLALNLLDQTTMAFGQATVEMLTRAETLISSAAAIKPTDNMVLWGIGYLRLAQERWTEAIAAFQRTIEAYPDNAAAYFMMGLCKVWNGGAREALPLFETALRRDPLEPQLHTRYSMMGLALLLIGNDEESIDWFQRALAANPEYTLEGRSNVYRHLACAYALTGRHHDARVALAEANKLWPYATVRGVWRSFVSSPALAEQLGHVQQGLRLAGLRDHVEEEADFGVAPQAVLRQDLAGLTPTTVPGTTTIRTDDLVLLQERQEAIVIDTVLHSWGRSIPNAVGLKNSGLGGSWTDTAQDRLRRKMGEMSKGDKSTPIVAVGWNSERFDSHNLTLRLAALGYEQVYWYRGGREAWEVNAQPETDLELQDW